MLRSSTLISVIAPVLLACNALTGADDLVISGGGQGGASGAGAGAPQTNAGNGASSGSGFGGDPSGTSAATTTTGPGSTTSGASTSSGTTSTAATTSSGGGTDPAQICVDFINQKRSTLGLPPYQRWTAEESCAAGEAQADYIADEAHSAFPSCGEWAQNECPGWPGPPEGMIEGCLQMMWDEGPGPFDQGHGHYINMSSTQYTRVACGFYVTPNGSVWAIQDFQ
jgi:hypothetical protein